MTAVDVVARRCASHGLLTRYIAPQQVHRGADECDEQQTRGERVQHPRTLLVVGQVAGGEGVVLAQAEITCFMYRHR